MIVVTALLQLPGVTAVNHSEADLNDIDSIADKWFSAGLLRDASGVLSLMSPGLRALYQPGDLEESFKKSSLAFVHLGKVEVASTEDSADRSRAVVYCATSAHLKTPSGAVGDAWESPLYLLGLEKEGGQWLVAKLPSSAAKLDGFIAPPRQVIGDLETDLVLQGEHVEKKHNASAPKFDDTLARTERARVERVHLREQRARQLPWLLTGAGALVVAGATLIIAVRRRRGRTVSSA